MNLNKLIRDLAPNLPADAGRKLQHIVDSPAVGELIAESEAALLRERKALRAQLAAAPSEFKDEQAKATAAANAAVTRLAAARVELDASITAHGQAQGAALSVSHRADMHTNRLIRQLEETADARLLHMINRCQNLIAEVQATANRNYPQRAEVYAVYIAARTALAGVIEQCAQMRLEPLPAAEVATRLRGFVVQITRAISPIGETSNLMGMVEELEAVIA